MEPMKIYVTPRILVVLLASLLLLTQPGWIPAQTLPKENSKLPVSAKTPSVAPPQTPPIQQSAAGAQEPEVVYGFQGVLVETLDGKTVATQAASENFNPA